VFNVPFQLYQELKNTANTKSTQTKLKPHLVASYDIRAWKRSGTVLVE